MPEHERRAAADINRRQGRARLREPDAPERQLALECLEMARHLAFSGLRRAAPTARIMLYGVMAEGAARLAEGNVHVEAGVAAEADGVPDLGRVNRRQRGARRERRARKGT